MGVSGILRMAGEYLVLGVIAAALFGIGYGLVYRKLLKGTHQIAIRKLILGMISICYLAVVFGATFLSRGGYYHEVVLTPFYSYRLAWNQQSVGEWRNLILNICLFIPWGFLLPMWGGRFRKIGWTLASGFAGSVLIETVQYIFSLGVVEFDDVFNNTLGTLIGFGLSVVWLELVALVRRKNAAKQKTSIVRICMGLLPLVLTIGAFGMVQLIYARMPYGILECASNGRVAVDEVAVSGKTEWKSTRDTVNIYKTVQAGRKEADELAEKLCQIRGTKIDTKRTSAYDTTAVYWSKEQEYNIWVEYKGLTYSITDMNKLMEETEHLEHADRAQVEELLEKAGVTLPKEAEFEELNDDGMYLFTVSMLPSGDKVLDGTVSVEIYADKTIGRLSYNVCDCEAYAAEQIISEQEAYDKLLNGEFNYYVGDEPIETIDIENVSLVYQMDSKAYYQPVYEFTGTINGEPDFIIDIPAVCIS